MIWGWSTGAIGVILGYEAGLVTLEPHPIEIGSLVVVAALFAFNLVAFLRSR